MQKQCEYLEACPMFHYFRRVAQKVYQEVYCQGDYVLCHRRKLRVAGEPVPKNLLPHGGKLWKDGDAPPEYWE